MQCANLQTPLELDKWTMYYGASLDDIIKIEVARRLFKNIQDGRDELHILRRYFKG